MKKLLSEQLVDYLERRDTKYVFGLCGHTVIAMLDALEKSKNLKYISVRHEQIASTAADGYARATGRASVVLCHLLTRFNKCYNRSCKCSFGFYSYGSDSRRCTKLLLWKTSSSRSEYAC